jgi:hypothetical protein
MHGRPGEGTTTKQKGLRGPDSRKKHARHSVCSHADPNAMKTYLEVMVNPLQLVQVLEGTADLQRQRKAMPGCQPLTVHRALQELFKGTYLVPQ